MSKDIRLGVLGKLRKSGTERKTLIHLSLNEVHHLRKITISPLVDFLVDGVTQVNLLSPAHEKAREAPVFLWSLVLQGMVMNTNSENGKTAWCISVLSAASSSLWTLNSQSHARWSLSKFSFQHAFPEMCANPKELHMLIWYWITFSVHEVTDNLLLHLKPAKTGRWSYGNRG